MDLKEIYEEHANFVWRVLLRLGVSEQEAHDAVQDVFMRVHAHLHEFQGKSSLKTWIFALTRSVARERRWHAGRAPRLTAEDELADSVDLRADVDRIAEHRERLVRFEQILADMPAEQRTVFLLFEVESFTGEEVSDALGVRLGTVYSRLKAARETFRAALTRLQAKERFVAYRTGGTP